MTKAARNSSLGVDWHLPDGKGGYKKRRFATTTPADSLSLALLAEEGHTVLGVKEALNWPSDEQTAVLDGFIAAGFGDTVLSTMVGRL